jgi:hypothetical protein
MAPPTAGLARLGWQPMPTCSRARHNDVQLGNSSQRSAAWTTTASKCPDVGTALSETARDIIDGLPGGAR